MKGVMATKGALSRHISVRRSKQKWRLQLHRSEAHYQSCH
jgi:hypothetical protein